MKREMIVLLSGPFGVGKSTVVTELIRDYEFRKIASSQYLLAQIPDDHRLEGPAARTQLQETGDRLDIETDYRWLADPVATSAVAAEPKVSNWLVDAVRKRRQVEHFRASFGPIAYHVHLTASEKLIRSRYPHSSEEYERAVSHPNEVSSRTLGEVADLVIDTTDLKPSEIAALIVRAGGGDA